MRVIPNEGLRAQLADEEPAFGGEEESVVVPPPGFVEAYANRTVPALEAGPQGGHISANRNGHYHVALSGEIDEEREQAEEQAALASCIMNGGAVSPEVMAKTTRPPGPGVLGTADPSPSVQLGVESATKSPASVAVAAAQRKPRPALLKLELSGSPATGMYPPFQPPMDSPAKAYRATATGNAAPTPRQADERAIEESAPDNRPLTLVVQPGEFVPGPERTLQVRASSKGELLIKIAAKLGLVSVTLEVFDADFEEWCTPTNLDAFGAVEEVKTVRVSGACTSNA